MDITLNEAGTIIRKKIATTIALIAFKQFLEEPSNIF